MGRLRTTAASDRQFVRIIGRAEKDEDEIRWMKISRPVLTTQSARMLIIATDEM